MIFQRVSRSLVWAWIAALRGYRVVLRPLFVGACRFHPTCSHYSEQAVRQYGVGRGFWLTVTRLARCHPFNLGGYDPIPVSPVQAARSRRKYLS